MLRTHKIAKLFTSIDQSTPWDSEARFCVLTLQEQLSENCQEQEILRFCFSNKDCMLLEIQGNASLSTSTDADWSSGCLLV